MTADTIGGVWTYALELAAALRKYEIEIALCTMGAPLTPQQRTAVDAISNVTVFQSHFKLEWMDNPWDDVQQAGEWLLQLGERLKPDVVHLNGYAHGALPWRIPVLVVGHSCVLSWWEAVKGEAAPPSWEPYRQQVRQGLQSADRVIAPSAAMLAALEQHYGTLANKKVVPNGCNPDQFYVAQKQDVIFTAGRLWDEAKNVGLLKDIAPDLSWCVCIAGEQQHPEESPQPSLKRGAIDKTDKRNKTGQKTVCWLGRLSAEEMAFWYARASIYVLPARYESFGLSVLEAALSGCALVLGDIPSLREIWQNVAVFVPPDNRDALKDAIEGLITDSAKRRQLASLARDRALKFTPQRMANSYLNTYQALIDQK
ncbi:MAG: glycosyltransferase family 4 protein [Coleofasciculus sp. G1-WW12-02]|uniref:glycosyltransferase family 4 protein n=1 Tax=Coleofasciculus sp. G1-WW12-02 TaxID=3068483 RepID=UPI0033026C91